MSRTLRVLMAVVISLPVTMLASCNRNSAETDSSEAPEARPVTLATASATVLPARLSAPAEVLSPNRSELSTEVTARVARVYADVGATVKAGARILALDSTDYRLALAQAEARVNAAKAKVALAERRVARIDELAQQRFASEDEVLAAKTELESMIADVQVAEADRDVAARNVAACLLIAPFDGVIVERMAQVGTLAPAGTPLVRLIDLSPAEVEASVSSVDAAGLESADELQFESQGKRYPVRLLRLAPVVDRAGRTRVARFGFVGDRAATGSSGTVSWRSTENLLPAGLLVKRADTLGYFVADEGIARFVAVNGAQEGRAFAVDLQDDALRSTLLVVRGHQGLNDGDAIVDAAAIDRNEADVESRDPGGASAGAK